MNIKSPFYTAASQMPVEQGLSLLERAARAAGIGGGDINLREASALTGSPVRNLYSLNGQKS